MKNQMKKLACLLLALVMMAGVLPVTERAADISYDVVGGKNLFRCRYRNNYQLRHVSDRSCDTGGYLRR